MHATERVNKVEELRMETERLVEKIMEENRARVDEVLNSGDSMAMRRQRGAS